MRSLVIALLAVTLLGTGAFVQERPPLQTDRDKLSYALGMDLGKQLRTKQVDLDAGVFARGLADALTGSALLLTDEESSGLVAALQEGLQRRELARVVEEADRNRRAGEAFLAENRKRAGVVTLASGLQYRVLTAGTGRRLHEDETALCHYRATFIDGTEFDNSYSRGEAAAIPVKSAVKGWSEALRRMPVGSRWQLFIPPELAYGSRGVAGRIAPNATLIFEVELLAIK